METKLIHKASRKTRRNAFYIIKDVDGNQIGSIIKPYFCHEFRATLYLTSETENFSTKESAESFIIREFSRHQKETKRQMISIEIINCVTYSEFNEGCNIISKLMKAHNMTDVHFVAGLGMIGYTYGTLPVSFTVSLVNEMREYKLKITY